MSRIALACLLALPLSLAGCENVPSGVAYRSAIFVEKPDVIVVRAFAPTLDASKKDGDVVPSWVLNSRAQPQTPDDLRAGGPAGDTVSQQVVAELKARGLPAVHASSNPTITKNSAIITGQFVNGESGTDSIRPAVGYRVEKPVEARVQIMQGTNFLGEIKCYSAKSAVSEGGAVVARMVTKVVADGYVTRGWLAPPPEK